MRELLWTIFGTICLIVFLVITGIQIREYRCEQRWARSGLDSEYSMNLGCMITNDHVHWIPEDAVRFKENF